MFTFNVVKQEHGWAVRMGERMCTPYRSRDLAIREAICLADDIRRHGECAEVIVEGAAPGEPLRTVNGASVARLYGLLRGRSAGPE